MSRDHRQRDRSALRSTSCSVPGRHHHRPAVVRPDPASAAGRDRPPAGARTSTRSTRSPGLGRLRCRPRRHEPTATSMSQNSMTLYQGDTPLAAATPSSCRLDRALPPERLPYRLVSRTPGAPGRTRTPPHTRPSGASPPRPPGRAPDVLPLIQLDYTVDTDTAGKAGRHAGLTVTPSHLPGRSDARRSDAERRRLLRRRRHLAAGRLTHGTAWRTGLHAPKPRFVTLRTTAGTAPATASPRASPGPSACADVTLHSKRMGGATAATRPFAFATGHGSWRSALAGAETGGRPVHRPLNHLILPAAQRSDGEHDGDQVAQCPPPGYLVAIWSWLLTSGVRGYPQ